MKRNYTYIIGFTFFLLFAWSCTDGQEEISGSGGKEQGQKVTLTLNSLPLQSSGTVTRSMEKGMDLILGDESAAGTRAVDDENKIDNLCVFQFEGTLGSSNAQLTGKTYISGLTNPTLPIVLEPFEQCFLYVCANVSDITGDYTVKSSTYQEIQNASYRISGQGDFDVTLPMSGCSEQLEGNVVTGSIGISLTRMVAKVSFTCNIVLPAGDALTITSAKLCNVPQTASYVFSDGNANAVGMNSHIGTNTSSTQTTATYVWYMSENKRGTKEGASSWAERIEKNAPNYASFIELTGNYTHSLGDAKTTTEVTYAIYLGNGTDYTNYDVERNHHYKVTSKIKGINFIDKRVTEYTNLSADGLANCYLASKDNHKYCFNGAVRGNGNTEDYAHQQYGGSLYENASFPSISMMPSKVGDAADVVTIPIESVAKAGLVWETKAGIIMDVSWDPATGCVKFETGSTHGNALLAVYDGNNKILWSWHIWRTDGVDLTELNRNHIVKFKTNTMYSWYSGEKGAYPGYGRERHLVMMECNIGAHLDSKGSAKTYAGNINEYNVNYQFGRKDPMPTITVGSGTWNIVDVSATETGFPDILDYIILHPNLFIRGIAATEYNWVNGATLNTEGWCVSNCLWGDNNPYGGENRDMIANLDPVPWGINSLDSKEANGHKTIYDPSPAGWRVAPSDTWSAVTTGTVAGWKNVNFYVSSFSNGYTCYFGGVGSGMSTFCPASGYRHGVEGTIYSVGNGGCSWLSSPGGKSQLGAKGFSYNSSPTFHVALDNYRGYGLPVRCVQE